MRLFFCLFILMNCRLFDRILSLLILYHVHGNMASLISLYLLSLEVFIFLYEDNF